LRDVLLALLFALSAGLAPTVLALMPRAATPVAVVAAPWANNDAARAVAAADGAILTTAHGGHIVIARFTTDDFVARLYRSGALLVIDAAIVTTCLRINSSLPGTST